MQETQVRSLSQEDPLEKEMATHFQYSCLENPMDREAWRATVHGVTKSQTWLSDWYFHFSLKLDFTARSWVEMKWMSGETLNLPG